MITEAREVGVLAGAGLAAHAAARDFLAPARITSASTASRVRSSSGRSPVSNLEIVVWCSPSFPASSAWDNPR